jgi:hypothetical protein
VVESVQHHRDADGNAHQKQCGVNGRIRHLIPSGQRFLWRAASRPR